MPPTPSTTTPGRFRLGPVLYWRGSSPDVWRVRIVVAHDTPPPPLRLAGDDRAWTAFWSLDGLTAYAVDLELPRGTDSTYAVGDRHWTVQVPAAGSDLRIACISCNGEEAEEPSQWRETRDQAWWHLDAAQRARPYHLLFQLGDQVYADPVWSCDGRLIDWRRSGRRQRAQAELPADVFRCVRRFYRDRYLETLGGAAEERLLAEVPQLAIWDDHDIFDGWGSWRDSDQDSPTFRGLFAAAREAFQVFQRGQGPDMADEGPSRQSPAQHLGTRLWLDDTLVVVPDLRSERRRDRILGPAGWRFLESALDEAQAARRVLVLCSVPFLNANFGIPERLLVLVPGQQLYQDDLRDQWTSIAHREEWRRLHARLAALADAGVEVSLLSGEIHLGALGVGCGAQGHYVQAITAGIAHRPPPQAFVRFLELLSWRPSIPGAPAGLVPLPEVGRRYLADRGWIDLELPRGMPARFRWRGPQVDALGIVLHHDRAR